MIKKAAIQMRVAAFLYEREGMEMKTISLPYGKTSVKLHVPEKNLKSVLECAHAPAGEKKNEEELVREALAAPVGTEKLCDMAEGKKKILIITSDHTRAMPSHITMPILLEEVRRKNPTADITILIATGLHRPTTEAEQRARFGDRIVDQEKIVVHNAFDESSLTYVCTLPSGAELSVNRLAVEADLIVCEGFIEPHFFAGFSGGRKSILPGIASAAAVNENHSYKAIADRNSRAGKLHGNVISEDMVFAARKVGVDFILNVALDDEKKIIKAVAGDLEKAHEEGCGFVKEQARVKPVTGDIVITSNGGYPLDQNLYQTPKSATTAEACAGEDGVIILVASCSDGLGGEHFEELMQKGTPEEIEKFLAAIPPRESISEQWCVQVFSRMLLKHKIILVSDQLEEKLVRAINMIPAKTPDEALEIAFKIKGEDASVVVIPDGVSVIAV